MGQNFLVQNLKIGQIGKSIQLLIEDNIGEGIHIHFRIDNSFDLRLNYSVKDYLNFCRLIESSLQKLQENGQEVRTTWE